MGSYGEDRSVVEEMQRTPDAVVLPFLGELRTCVGELSAVLGGRPLRVEVVIDADRRALYRVTFTPTGTVELTGAYGFDPHLTIRGTPDQVVGVLLGGLDTFDAVYHGVLALHFPADELVHFPPVRALLAREIEECRRSRGE